MKNEANHTQQLILSAGYKLFASKGFSSVGLTQILREANTPKGSFYHYFDSKEQFGKVLIDDYFIEYHHNIERTLNDSTLNGYTRLMNYWQSWVDNHADINNCKRCLVVKLTAEVADLSEPMRISLRQGSNKVITLIDECLKAGIEDGSIAKMNTAATATMLYQMWLGAGLLHKLDRQLDSFHFNIKMTQSILKNTPFDAQQHAMAVAKNG